MTSAFTCNCFCTWAISTRCRLRIRKITALFTVHITKHKANTMTDDQLMILTSHRCEVENKKQVTHTKHNALMTRRFVTIDPYRMCLEWRPEKPRHNLIHAIVLIMSANREMNLKRREIMKPDLNSQYSALCSASTPVTMELFGDDVGKQIDEVTKANKLAKKIAGPKTTRISRSQPYGRNSANTYQSKNRSDSRNFSQPRHFLGDRNAKYRKPNMKTASFTKTTQN